MSKIAYALIGIIVVGALMTVAGIILFPNSSQVSAQEGIYSQLPSVSKDLQVFKREIETGSYIEICDLEEDVWKRPEFYPTWEKAKRNFYENHDYSSWGVHGYGAYPAEGGMSVSNLKKGESIDVCFIIKSGYGVETYQGAKLAIKVPEGFNVEVVNPMFEDYKDNILLEPTFPEFKSGWARMLRLKLTTNKNIDVGSYDFAVNLIAPEDKFNSDQNWKILLSDSPDLEKQVNECKSQVNLDKDCQQLIESRQKKYLPAGSYGIGRDMWSFKLEVEA